MLIFVYRKCAPRHGRLFMKVFTSFLIAFYRRINYISVFDFTFITEVSILQVASWVAKTKRSLKYWQTKAKMVIFLTVSLENLHFLRVDFRSGYSLSLRKDYKWTLERVSCASGATMNCRFKKRRDDVSWGVKCAFCICLEAFANCSQLPSFFNT